MRAQTGVNVTSSRSRGRRRTGSGRGGPLALHSWKNHRQDAVAIFGLHTLGIAASNLRQCPSDRPRSMRSGSVKRGSTAKSMSFVAKELRVVRQPERGNPFRDRRDPPPRVVRLRRTTMIPFVGQHNEEDLPGLPIRSAVGGWLVTLSSRGMSLFAAAVSVVSAATACVMIPGAPLQGSF